MSRRLRIFAFLSGIFCLALLIAVSARQFSSADSPPQEIAKLTPSEEQLFANGGRIVVADNGERVIVGSPDDPSNPYKFEYKAWDRWLFENLADDPNRARLQLPEDISLEEATPIIREHDLRQDDRRKSWTADTFGLRTWVTEEGFLVPLFVGRQIGENAIRSGNDDWAEAYLWVEAEGQAKKELRDSVCAAEENFKAKLPLTSAPQ
jgi:hypothetical protein